MKFKCDKQTSYDRKKLKTKIVHIGCGAFHRAHQALYTDLANQEEGGNWGICEFSLFSGKQIVDDLREQDYLYALLEKDKDKEKSRLIRCLTEAWHPDHEGVGALLEKIAEPQVAIVSATITEKGYCVSPRTKQLDRNNPLIEHDLEHPEKPRSAIGVIVGGLGLRKRRGLAPLSVVSCDNLPGNGEIFARAVLDFAGLVDPELADWIEKAVSFPSTMVDRIVPAMGEAEYRELRQTVGTNDRCGVIGESFKQWVVEENFVAGRPAWEKVGAMLVDDVAPYERMKLRMLNGAHSFLAYNGFLGGHQYILDCMADDIYRQACLRLMLDEQALTLDKDLNVDLRDYAHLLIDRFSNPNIRHKTSQIAGDGSQKLPQRAIEPCLALLEMGRKPVWLPLLIAGWTRYVEGVDEAGGRYEIIDPMQSEIAQTIEGKTVERRLKALFGLKAIFPPQAADNPILVESVKTLRDAIDKQGIRQVIKGLLKTE